MVWATALALSLITTSSGAQEDRFPDSPWLNWVAANSPNGFDITPDGDLWINLAEVGQSDDYAVRAEDLKAARDARNQNPSFWIRGYHKRNPKVSYRESKVMYSLDCARKTVTRIQGTYYAADGDVVYQQGFQPFGYVVPGSMGAEYHRLFCLSA